jgi:hypothetical protein
MIDIHKLSTTLMYVQVSSNTVMNCSNNINTVTMKICYTQSVNGSMLLLKLCQCETLLKDYIRNTQTNNTNSLILLLIATVQNIVNHITTDLSVLLR